MTVTVLAGSDSNQVGADASTILSALLERDWRVVHLVGYGEPPRGTQPSDGSPAGPGPWGVALSQGAYLGAREFASMRKVPELVFVNCCHLPALTSEPGTSPGAYNYSRASFAAEMGETLLGIGVRCTVVAGWPVDDSAASMFADRFYAALLRGQRFRDAVTAAREAVLNLGSTSTWGAYQCYGDPNWTLGR